MENKKNIFIYILSFTFIMFVGTMLVSCNSKSESQEKIEVEEEINNEMEDIGQQELQKIVQITIFIINIQKDSSITDEQIEQVDKAYNEYQNKYLENITKSLEANLADIPYDSLKVDQENINNYYATLKNILPAEIYDKCVSYSTEELEKLNLEKYNGKLQDIFSSFKDIAEENKELAKKFNIEQNKQE